MKTCDRATRKPSTAVVASRRGVRTLLLGLVLTSLIASVATAISSRSLQRSTEPTHVREPQTTQREESDAATWIRMLDAIRGSDLWAPIYASREVTHHDPIDGTAIDFGASGADEEAFVENPEPNAGLLTGLGLLGLAARRYRRH